MRWILPIFFLVLCGTLHAQSIPNYRRPLFVSHLSGTNKTIIRRAGAPKHNAITKVICFKKPCRGVVGWTRTQQRNKFKRYKKPGIPRLKYLKQDSLRKTEVQPLPVVQDTTVTSVVARPVHKDSVMSFVFDEVLFDTNSSDLSDAFTKHLDSLSALIRKYENYRVQVVGHTDNSGSERSNATLSQERAEAVASYLASAGINRDVIMAEGRGSKEPVADNRYAEGREKNRRVEVFLVLE